MTGAAEGRVDRRRVVLLFGGRSPEHDISCATASVVLGGFDPERYDVVPIGITVDGVWVAARPVAAGTLPGAVEQLAPVGPPVDPWDTLRPEGQPQGIVCPVLLGPNGEDGTVQGLLEMADVPYIGSGVLGSALGIDKSIAKELLAARNIPQARHRTVAREDADDRLADEVADALGFPVIVKPTGQGSSIGITLANGPDDLPDAVTEALRYGDTVLLEEFLDVRELQCSVMGGRAPKASAVAEVISEVAVYDFNEKYGGGSQARVVIPAELPDAVTDTAQSLAIATYRTLRAEGLARVDLFLTGDRRVLVNEINTMPAITERMIVPRMWEAAGLFYPDIIDRLVDEGLERHARRAAAVDRPYRP